MPCRRESDRRRATGAGPLVDARLDHALGRLPGEELPERLGFGARSVQHRIGFEHDLSIATCGAMTSVPIVPKCVKNESWVTVVTAGANSAVPSCCVSDPPNPSCKEGVSGHGQSAGITPRGW